MPDVKITVIKTTLHQDLVEATFRDRDFAARFGRCPIFREGQAFVSSDWPSMPEGFCQRAWPDIRHEVAMVMYGASVPWIEAPGFTVTCCNDGLRPVIFRIERVSDGAA